MTIEEKAKRYDALKGVLELLYADYKNSAESFDNGYKEAINNNDDDKATYLMGNYHAYKAVVKDFKRFIADKVEVNV